MFGEYNLPLDIVFRYLYVYVYVPGANLSRSGVLLTNSVLFSQKEATFFLSFNAASHDIAWNG